MEKRRRLSIDEEVDEVIKETWRGIKKHRTKSIEIGTGRGRVHFLVQARPTYSSSKISHINAMFGWR